MAGDWVPIRISLADDPDVIAIAGRLQLDEDTVVGKLVRFWGWADQHTSDGNADSVTYSWLDRHIGVPGFCAALELRGWIAKTDEGISVPNFDRFLGKGGKTRVKTAERVAKHRKVAEACNGSVTPEALPQNITEKNKEPSNEGSSSAQAHPVSKSQAEQLYAAYPRKVAKANALKTISVALRDTPFDVLAEAVAEYGRSRVGKDPNLTPYPATWFRSRRWEDDRKEWFRDERPTRAGPVASAAPAIGQADVDAALAKIRAAMQVWTIADPARCEKAWAMLDPRTAMALRSIGGFKRLSNLGENNQKGFWFELRSALLALPGSDGQRASDFSEPLSRSG